MGSRAILLAALASAVTATAAHAGTPVKGYVSAGGPVAGATLTVDGVRSAHASDRHGFFVLDVKGAPRVIRIQATGGHVGTRQVHGALRAVVLNPARARGAYVNPISTMVAAYLDLRPGTSLDVARERVKKLLGLAEADDTDRALRGRPRYFDGIRFLRYADSHGGIDKVVRGLIARMDTRRGAVSAFQRPRVFFDTDAVSTSPFSRTLSTAGSAIGIISGIGSIVNDIIGWSKKPEPSNGQIYTAVEQMQSQLSAIDEQLSSINSEIATDFAVLKQTLDLNTYNAAVDRVKTLAGEVESAQADWEDMLNLATSSSFSLQTWQNDFTDLQGNMQDIKASFVAGNDVFGDALADNAGSAYHLLATYLLDESNNYVTPELSTTLADFRNYVLYHQALAFSLLTAYWSQGATPATTILSNTNLKNTVQLYLGNSSDWQSWVAANPSGTTPTAAPASGDLHDELGYLQGISAVPAGTIVDPKGTMWWTTPTGPQSLSSFTTPAFGIQANTAVNGLSMNAYVPDKAGCQTLAYTGVGVGTRPPDETYYGDESWPSCDNLWSGLQSAHVAAVAAASSAPAATGLGGWAAAPVAAIQTLLNDTTGRSLVSAASSYAISTAYWDGTMWCASTKTTAQTCSSPNDYDAAAHYFDDAGQSCNWNTSNHCSYYDEYFYQYIQGIWIPTYNAIDRNLHPALVSVDGASNQVGGMTLFMLPSRPTSGEKYLP